jgi:hypothetical protein
VQRQQDHGERHHHVQEHLTHAFGCDNHALNIGTPVPGRQLEVPMRAFEAAYRA